MPVPSTIAAFLELVRKSGVLDDKRLEAYLGQKHLTSALVGDADSLARRLVRDGLLTTFQAEQLMQGKWRGFLIGKFKVLEPLVFGGMGKVFLCEQTVMRRRVAIKLLPTARSSDRAFLEGFYRAAHGLAVLDHLNLVRFLNIDQDQQLHFLVMEYVDGSSLHEIVKISGPLHANRAAHYISQAALGLQHAFDKARLVHRDIKPSNIMVDRSGTVKVIDLGLARFFYDEDDVLIRELGDNIQGTIDYMAPEQVLDSTVDSRRDVYSLGNTMYFCLTGRAPFSEGKLAQKLVWHQTRQPRPIRNSRPEVPEALVAVIDKMIAKDPSKRYQTPAAAAEALTPWTQTPIPPPSELELPRRSLAALGPPVADLSTMISTPPVSSASETPPSKRNWQVASPPSPPPPTETEPGTSPRGDPQ